MLGRSRNLDNSQSAILALEQVNVRSKCLAATLDILNKAADVCDGIWKLECEKIESPKIGRQKIE